MKILYALKVIYLSFLLFFMYKLLLQSSHDFTFDEVSLKVLSPDDNFTSYSEVDGVLGEYKEVRLEEEVEELSSSFGWNPLLNDIMVSFL